MANEGSTKPTYSELEAIIDAGRAEDARMTDEILKLETELARVRGLLQRQWISVEERLPEDDDTSVWVCFENGSHYCSARYIDDEWFGYDLQMEDTFHIEQKITHWMPLHKLTNFPQSSELVPSGAESADIGKLDAADKSGVEMGKEKIVAKEITTAGWTKMKEAGSAETGGEKADWQMDIQLLDKLLEEHQAFAYDGEIGIYLSDISPETVAELRKRLATFRSSSQNQAVTSGVEGAHEGTTADKSGSREPEKLWCPECCTESGKTEYGECANNFHKSLAESSLSSPPPNNSDLSAPTFPAPLSTQPDTTKEKQ